MHTRPGPAISAVSVVEMVGGVRSHERREVGRLFASLKAFPVNDRVAGISLGDRLAGSGRSRGLRAGHIERPGLASTFEAA